MAKEYDVKDVDDYIADVMRMHPLQRVDLWLVLQQEMNGRMADEGLRLLSRFSRHSLAVRANILFRFIPILEDAARGQAKAKALAAREAGVM